jgi:hypothetical protein
MYSFPDGAGSQKQQQNHETSRGRLREMLECAKPLDAITSKKASIIDGWGRIRGISGVCADQCFFVRIVEFTCELVTVPS